MFLLRQRLTALVLALSHALIGVSGYALHELVPCEAAECQHEVASVCSCGHAHKSAPQLDQETSLPFGRTLSKSDGHDAGHCALCALLAKFKAGFKEYAASELVQPYVALPPTVADSVLGGGPLQSPPARGPPVPLV